ncbi:MAG: metallophosphoesterase family protein [Rhodopseudomonas sp.]|uniref:metallophosphoesterase family protein n=1 Tax=Rhodopseudomonas sp. TaxID=1078 RepID=UPI0018012A11|nr:metallophosphoesterase family protein [Rhodopseudomonas sp.]NVN88433.1 metallophosphoesterase family protein [Rhodopseudomonas sp.]
MRFAAIADVHGNYLALEAVLADIRAQRIDDIVNLGDMASGPLDAGRTVEIMMGLDATCVRGNHDRYLTDFKLDDMYPSDRLAHGQLTPKYLDWLRALPFSAVYRDSVYLCHATPDDDNTYWLETVTPEGGVQMAAIEQIEERAQGIAQSLILCAHTHIPRAVRLRDGRMIVNPGSVGCPGYRDVVPYPHIMETGTPDASYAILEERANRWQVTFRQVPYDHAAMAALARQNGRLEWASVLATGWLR